ncbi:CpsD/CapB family tyrosine-protein kinase [Vibrio sp. SCSIO 43136]|uniref:CpsD/CapB family tyrosine-protein kinase n=1 Tax=Vibrio sp. SCSIO 43136 TaxID=2819101 RepID=UPI002075CDDF|nr:CpsD/CapB family tyrosine-protein kinase [Vibrio sp. SCSIO 43136]USD67800.1 CpsD/CapB family tyrosine-protein kinase [Vibrio sp. SCSIO 43136]
MTIPATHYEIEQLYLSAELAECRSICLTGCQSGDGVTAFATALAERYLLAGHRTLLVDLNLHRPAFTQIETELGNQSWLEHKQTKQTLLGAAIPTDQSTLLALKDPQQLKNNVGLWLESYDRVIIDTSAMLQVNRGNIPAQVVASACDTTILVALAGVTTNRQVSQAVELLQLSKANLMGTVLNHRDQPNLAQELSRQVEKLFFLPRSFRRSIKNALQANEFLNQVV